MTAAPPLHSPTRHKGDSSSSSITIFSPHRSAPEKKKEWSFYHLAAAVLALHLTHSLLQEAVFFLPGFNHTVLLALLQSLSCAMLAFLDYKRQNVRRSTCPVKVYLLISVFMFLSTALTAEASQRLSYPTQVIFKSSKLLFVMLLRSLVFRHQKLVTSPGELIGAVKIVLGLILFTWATSEGKKYPLPSSHLPSSASNAVFAAGYDVQFSAVLGVTAILIAICCDAGLYLGQERLCFVDHQATETEVLVAINVFASCYAMLTLLVSGRAVESFHYLVATPKLAILVVAFSVFLYAGTYVLLMLVRHHGSPAAVVVTSTRKLFTIVFSFIVYPKPLSVLHAIGVVLVASGIYVHDRFRSRKPESNKKADGHNDEVNEL